MKTLALLAVLATSFFPISTLGQKYLYDKGYFERDGVNWAQYAKENPDIASNYYQQIDVMEDYYVISDGITKIAVPKTLESCFLIADPDTGKWKYFSRPVDPNAPKPVRKPRLTPEQKDMVVRNFRHTTPYDGIHMYTSPFGYINTRYITIDDAREILNSNDHYNAQVQDDGTLLVERKDNVGYEDFGAKANTMITGQFDNGRINKCTYVFTMPDSKSAQAAMAHLVKHMGIASSGRDGKRYKVAWLKDVSYFDMKTQDGDDGALFIVEVEYK